MSDAPIRFAAIGLDHRHIYDMVGGLLKAGAECVGYCPETSDPRVLSGFQERHPALRQMQRDAIFDAKDIDLIVCAAIPRDRAGIAIRAMSAGKDVMVDKPGVTTMEQLIEVEKVAEATGRIFSICFSERFFVPACEVAAKLVQAGAIGRVIQTVGLGPHRLNRAIRPDWFFDKAAFGGILADLASHQIDQFLFYTGETDAQITAANVANRAFMDDPDFDDFGEILLQGKGASAYVRVDWFTPDGLPTWGDGRLFLLGTLGTIELRKYVDVAGRPGTDHLLLSTMEGVRYIDASAEPLTYFDNLIRDVRHRTEFTMPRAHGFTVTRLALQAQAQAKRI